METFLITGISDPTGDSYDAEHPTRQTELLSLSLRNLLYNLQDAHLPLAHELGEMEEIAISGLLNDAADDFTSAMIMAEEARETILGENPDLPAIPEAPDFLSIILPLLPALLRGTVGLPALIPVLLPMALRILLNKGFSDLLTGDNSSLAGISDALAEIKEEIHTNTEKIIEGYNSCSDAIAELQELKQICVMRTSEIDKVILQEPI